MDNITFKKRNYKMLMKTIAGSRLYGTSFEKGENPINPDYVSDYDYRGYFKAPIETKIGLLGKVEQIELGEYDEEYYEIKKFMKLCADNNPNIFDILFAPPHRWLISTPEAELLYDNRYLFLSKKCKFTFSGYAYSQLKRIKSHNKWINKFPETTKVLDILQENHNKGYFDFRFINAWFGSKVAKRITGETEQTNKKFNKPYDMCIPIVFGSNYNLPDITKYITIKDYDGNKIFLNNDILKLKLYNPTENIYYLLDEKSESDFIEYNQFVITKNPKSKKIKYILSFNKNQYISDKENIKSMWDWRLNRNTDRLKLEDKFGYDIKHGMHLFRLLLCSESILKNCDYNPVLSGEILDAVLEIRNGNVSYDDLISMAKRKEEEIEKLYETSKLQHKCDINKINDLLIKISI